MVKLTGPMGSAQASGAFGKKAVFSSWKGRAYAKSHAVPTNPRSPMQTAVRLMLQFLAQQWSQITSSYASTWSNPAAKAKLPNYNAFIAANLERWRRFKAPSQNYPVTETGSLPKATLDFTTVDGTTVKLHWTMDSPRDSWGLLLFRSTTTPVVPTLENLIAILQATDNEEHWYDDEYLDPGTYYYQGRFFTEHGKMGPNEDEQSATVP